MSLVKGNEIPTIDVCLVTVTTKDEDGDVEQEIGLETADQISVEPQIETQDAVKLIIKGQLKAQKQETSTITGNQITLRDNIFNPQLVMTMQGGTIEFDATETTLVRKYTPPVVGSKEIGKIFELNAYSAVYDTAGIILRYEKITYPNCKGVPIAMSSEDNVFRVSEYTINSAPKEGEAPYVIEYVDSLPAFATASVI